MSKKTSIVLLGLMVLLSSQLFSQELQKNQIPYAWLEGTWIGNGFGGVSEETWSSPSEEGKMMGMYRHHTEKGALTFYEFIILDEAGMHVKHFTSDLVAWEEKEEYETFEMISYDENSIFMNGLTYKLINPNEMEIHLVLENEDGSITTEMFKMSRK